MFVIYIAFLGLKCLKEPLGQVTLTVLKQILHVRRSNVAIEKTCKNLSATHHDAQMN